MIPYDGASPRRYIPVLPEVEGYIIEYDEESGWPYYITVEAAAQKRAIYKSFMDNITKNIQGEPRKGIIQIISTPADVSGTNDDFKNLWTEFNK